MCADRQTTTTMTRVDSLPVYRSLRQCRCITMVNVVGIRARTQPSDQTRRSVADELMHATFARSLVRHTHRLTDRTCAGVVILTETINRLGSLTRLQLHRISLPRHELLPHRRLLLKVLSHRICRTAPRRAAPCRTGPSVKEVQRTFSMCRPRCLRSLLPYLLTFFKGPYTLPALTGHVDNREQG